MKKTLIAPILLLIALVAGALVKLRQVRNTAGPWYCIDLCNR
jgi:hypothetical protein